MMTGARSGLRRREEGKAESWHNLAEAEIYSRLRTTVTGLSDEQNRERLIEYGENMLPVRKPPTLMAIFLHQFKSPLIYVLLVAAVVALVLAEHTDAGFIFAVLLLNAGLGTFQEWNAERSAAGLQKLLAPSARVRRMARRHVLVRKLPAVEGSGELHMHHQRQDWHSDSEPADGQDYLSSLR